MSAVWKVDAIEPLNHSFFGDFRSMTIKIDLCETTWSRKVGEDVQAVAKKLCRKTPRRATQKEVVMPWSPWELNSKIAFLVCGFDFYLYECSPQCIWTSPAVVASLNEESHQGSVFFFEFVDIDTEFE